MHAPLLMQGLRMLQVLALSWQSGPVKVVGHVQLQGQADIQAIVARHMLAYRTGQGVTRNCLQLALHGHMTYRQQPNPRFPTRHPKLPCRRLQHTWQHARYSTQAWFI